MSDVVYGCNKCGKQVAVPVGKPAPRCCGRMMETEPLPYCTSAPDAEQTRSHRADEPCNDGTFPKKKA